MKIPLLLGDVNAKQKDNLIGYFTKAKFDKLCQGFYFLQKSWQFLLHQKSSKNENFY